ncbi:MAG: hypothetical protein JW967_01530 [Dehalococcoidales bacterium]|nr:hypothetical protein [Dehalococcoidales bacterium]
MDEKTVVLSAEDILKAVKEGVTAGVGAAKLDEIPKVISMGFNEASGKFEAKLAELTKEPDTAKLDESAVGVLGKAFDFKVMGLPLGGALVGGFTATFATELLDGLMVNQKDYVKGIVKLGGAFAAVKFGKKVFGTTGANVVGLLMAFDGLRNIIPLDIYANKLASKITGWVPAQGLSGIGRRTTQDINLRKNLFAEKMPISSSSQRMAIRN